MFNKGEIFSFVLQLLSQYISKQKDNKVPLKEFKSIIFQNVLKKLVAIPISFNLVNQSIDSKFLENVLGELVALGYVKIKNGMIYLTDKDFFYMKKDLTISFKPNLEDITKRLYIEYPGLHEIEINGVRVHIKNCISAEISSFLAIMPNDLITKLIFTYFPRKVNDWILLYKHSSETPYSIILSRESTYPSVLGMSHWTKLFEKWHSQLTSYVNHLLYESGYHTKSDSEFIKRLKFIATQMLSFSSGATYSFCNAKHINKSYDWVNMDEIVLPISPTTCTYPNCPRKTIGDILVITNKEFYDAWRNSIFMEWAIAKTFREHNYEVYFHTLFKNEEIDVLAFSDKKLFVVEAKHSASKSARKKFDNVCRLLEKTGLDVIKVKVMTGFKKQKSSLDNVDVLISGENIAKFFNSEIIL